MQNSTLILTQVDQMNSNVVFFNAQGVNGIAQPNATTNIDLKMLDDNFLTGGHLRVRGATFGDYCHVQVIDKDGVVYPAGTILRQFVTNWFLSADDSMQADFDITYPAKILTGWYIRLVYVSIGMAPAQAAFNYDLHKALV